MEFSRYLLIALPNNTINIFDVESKSLPQWQRALSEVVSKRVAAQKDPTIGASFVPTSRRLPLPNGDADAMVYGGKGAMAHQSVVLWGSNWICRFRLHPRSVPAAGGSKRRREEDVEDGDEGGDEETGSEEEEGEEEPPAESKKAEKKRGRGGKNRIRGSGEGEMFLRIFNQYRNLLGVEFLNSEEMVVVERPLIDVLSALPPAYFKAKYGT